MVTLSPQASIGPVLREWRERRRLTQLELALEAGISTRHLSFVETGRSKPGREMLLRILEQLDIPFREQNRLLLASGHAPAFPERSLEDPELLPVREALDQILTGHEPYPAVVVDRAWNLVAANPAMRGLTEEVVIDPALLEPPVNIMRLGFHPRGLAPLIVNLGQWRAHFCQRLERQPAVTRHPHFGPLLQGGAGTPSPAPPGDVPVPPTPGDDPDPAPDPAAREMLGPVRFHAPGGGELSFFGM